MSRSRQPHNPIPFVRSPYLWSDLQHPQYFRNNDGAHSMKPRQIWDDTRGSVLVEFTVTLPLFLLLMFGLLQAGLLLYTQAGLQHGVEAAARCASVNYSANQLGLSQSCFIVSGSAIAPSSVTTTNIRQYAQQNSWGVNPSLATFYFVASGSGSPNTNTCGTTLTRFPATRLPQAITYNIMRYLFHPDAQRYNPVFRSTLVEQDRELRLHCPLQSNSPLRDPHERFQVARHAWSRPSRAWLRQSAFRSGDGRRRASRPAGARRP